MDETQDEPLELTIEVGEDEGEETLIAFSDEAGADEEETPLIKKLRQQIRDMSRERTRPKADEEPEPAVPDEPGELSEYDFDESRQRAAWKAHTDAKDRHRDWESRANARRAEREKAANETARKIDQQRNALGVADYEDRAQAVHDRLSEAQIAILINGAEDPAKLIYALGRSPSRLDLLAGEDNLARFAVTLGKLEKEIKVTKRRAPNPESRVIGATASASEAFNDKELERLEREADRTNDRSKVIAYKRQRKAA